MAVTRCNIAPSIAGSYVEAGRKMGKTLRETGAYDMREHGPVAPASDHRELPERAFTKGKRRLRLRPRKS